MISRINLKQGTRKFSLASRGFGLLAGIVLVTAMTIAGPTTAAADTPREKPTIILVHGAFAGSSSWNPVISQLAKHGYPTIAAANPLRSVKGDAAYVSSLVKSVAGPVVLVGHSYGGSVITDAASGNSNVVGLVYVAGFAPEVGETAAGLGAKFPGSTLGPTIAPPVVLSDGSKDLYISREKYHLQFAADVSADDAVMMAATQRPILESAFDDPTQVATWKTIPSWFVYGTLDKNISPELHAFLAKRAAARKTVAVKGSSHVVMLSHPDVVAAMIMEAAGG